MIIWQSAYEHATKWIAKIYFALPVEGMRNKMWNTYVALDLETTGLSPMRDQILEIGAARVENGEITGTYETFVDSGVEIPARITDLTGITAEMKRSVTGTPTMGPRITSMMLGGMRMPSVPDAAMEPAPIRMS